MIRTLGDHPLLLLFLVASIGYFIGNLKIKGISLGVAGVLFTGLAFGAIDPNLKIPEVIFILGLILFVYSIGLQSGPAFFKSYQKNGLRDFLFLTSMLVMTGLLAVILSGIFGFSAATITGLYAGSTTNTPALAGVIDYINNINMANSKELINMAVIGYSFSYPMGVMGGIVGILIMEKVLGINYKKEEENLKDTYPTDLELSSRTIKITHENIIGKNIRDINKSSNWKVVYGRMKKGTTVTLADWSTELDRDDVIAIVGTKDDLDAATVGMGEIADDSLDFDRSKYDVRRIFVSNEEVIGKSIASLSLRKNYDATISRIRRGDIDMLAHDDFVLEAGDRIRFVAKRQDLKALSDYFGDSYSKSSRINLFTFGIGIALGLLLGTISLPLWPGFSFKLGYAGGVLIIGLLLGALRRTGPIVWIMPYSAHVTFQQIGLILLLAGVGVSSGSSLVASFNTSGLWIFIASAIIAIVSVSLILLVGYKIVKIPFSILLGIVSNQPAILDFAMERSNNRIPQYGYAMMLPIASIMKIIIAQIIFIVLS